MTVTYLDVSQPEHAIPEHQQINNLALHDCSFLFFCSLKTRFLRISKTNSLLDNTAHVQCSHPENAIPEHQEIDPLAGWYCSYLNVSQNENAIPDNQQIDSLAVPQSPYLNVLQLENRIPEYKQINHLTEQHYPYLNVSKPENVIPENQQIEVLS